MRVVREVANQLRWQLFGLLCVALILSWIAYWLMGKVFIRRFSHGRAWDSRG
jgi:hypothetical protein